VKNRSETKIKRKKVKKSEKKRKKVKKSEKNEKIDLNFASLCFASVQSEKFKAKKSEKNAKKCEKREVKFYSEIVKHM
jgi:hypothetical protein